MPKIISIPPNYFYFCILLNVFLYFLFPQMSMIKYPYSLLGILLIVLGLYLIFKSWYLFKDKKTPESFSPSIYLVKEHLYKYSRNPMYLGGVLFLLGLVVLSRNVLAFLSPFIFFLFMNFMFIPYEEEKNEKTFGQDFLEYKKKVKRWL